MGKKWREILGSFTIILMIVASVFISLPATAKPKKTLIAGNRAMNSYTNMRHIVWEERRNLATIKLYDMETSKYVTLNGGVEMKNENCIYQGTSNVCWTTMGFRLQGIASDFKTIYTITNSMVPNKRANIHGSVVTFYCLDDPGGIFYFDFEKPENGKNIDSGNCSRYLQRLCAQNF